MTVQDMVTALNQFYHNYVVTTANGSFQVFQSFTYGEMAIFFMLFAIFSLMLLKWVFEVLR